MCEETNQERQDSELVALQAIYGDAVEDNREKAVWNNWRPLDVLIALQPLHNTDGVHCSVTLQFSCSHNYPDKPPKISIHKKSGLSDNTVSKLLKELDDVAQQHSGEVMIYELAQHTEEFLDNYNKPTLSFYEEMVQKNDEMEKLKQQQLQIKDNEELQKMKDEIQRRHEALHCDSVDQDINGQGDVPKLVYYADDKMSPAKKMSRKSIDKMPCTCNLKGTKVIRYTQKNNKKVYVGNCIGHSTNGAITFQGIDEDGEPMIIKNWTISPSPDIPTRTKQLNAIHQDLKAMSRLKNPYLSPYIAIEITTESKRSGKQLVYVFREYVTGLSLKSFLEMSSNSDFGALKVLRHVALGVFSALSELHSVNVLHRDIRSETVFVNSGSVKLVGASLDVRLADIVDGVNYCDRQTKCQDIYAAAQLLLSIVTDESDQEIPSDLPGSAKDFFSRCLTEDDFQWTAEQLVNHGFLVDTPTNMPSSKENNDVDSGSEDEDGSKRNHDISSLVNGHSRLNIEFEVLDWLGKGAFGDVVKVRNKLDGSFYAIKHVKLNPRSVDLNKNITREVKLLSRLNHENVVRYYNAWIEEITETHVKESVTPDKSDRNSLEEVVAKLGQEVKVNWSMSEGPVLLKDESSDDEDSDDEAWFNESPEDATSSSIEFESDSNKSLTLPSEGTTAISPMLKQVLYIQMEFCEKNTLRHAIDNGLYQDHFRSWRLFREILEGLAHVHQKGMIHRDLKPMNIFLDSKDHVKIGDFGLATKIFSGLPIVDEKASQEDYDGTLTGKVGTALYVAPELHQSESKVISKQKYNQKVDIYSLGIILFEMFHPPFKTGSERYIVITNLRKKEVVVPKEFQKEKNFKQIHVIRWLLDHDASSRPTSLELLASEHVPRAVPEGTLSCLLSHALNERGSRGYQRLIAACLDQKPSPAEDFTYHKAIKSKSMDIIAGIKDVVVKVFRHHGAHEFSPPLLMPRARRWDQYPNAVRVMTSSGSVCHLTHDLRLPFARHTAYHDTRYMRRYVVDRVYRETERTVKGFHPREIIECAFDIVTPKTDTLWPDAELLVVACRAASESSLKVSIQLNHTELLNALLSSCGVPADKHARIYPVLVDVSLGRITSLQLQTHLTTLCVSNRDITNIRRLMEANVPVSQLRELVGSVGRNLWSSQIERAVRQLETLCVQAEGLGCDVPITVAPFLAYNATQHSGVFWQMSVRHEQKAIKHRSRDLIAVGGRYDNLVEEFWKIARAEKDRDNSSLKCTSVGFSMSLERMAAILHAAKTLEDIPPVVKDSELKTICICVCNTDNHAIEIKRARIAQALWSSGLSAICWSGAVCEAHDLTKCAVVLVHDKMETLVSCWEGTRLREYKVPSSKVVDFVKQKLSPDTIRNPELSNRAISWSESEKSSSPSISVTFITASDKMTKSMKRQCEMQINNKITSNLDMLGVPLNRIRVSALALACDSTCVRLLAANLSAPLQADSLPRAFTPVLDAYTKRQNILEEALRELTNIVKQSSQGRSPEEIHIYALYSIPDSLCRIIT